MGFFRYAPKAGRKRDRTFRAVVGSPWACEFVGTLPRLLGTGTEHTLLCARIPPDAASALLDQGFRPVAGICPTHGIFCTFKLARNPNQVRCLFNAYLDVQHLPGHLQDWAAVQISIGIRHELLTCNDQGFLIRCHSSKEFPWCVEDDYLDLYWLGRTESHLKRVYRILDERSSR